MKNVNCEIVRDLLPSYLDRIATGTTVVMLEEHLAECADCRQKYETLKYERAQSDVQETRKGRNFQKKLLEYRAYMIGFLIGVCLPIITITAIFFLRVFYVAIRDFLH